MFQLGTRLLSKDSPFATSNDDVLLPRLMVIEAPGAYMHPPSHYTGDSMRMGVMILYADIDPSNSGLRISLRSMQIQITYKEEAFDPHQLQSGPFKTVRKFGAVPKNDSCSR